MSQNFRYDLHPFDPKEQVRNVREIVARRRLIMMCIYALTTVDALTACWNWYWIELRASDRHLNRKLKTGLSLLHPS